MSGRDIALTGLPRGGTTLACRLLGLASGTVALSEPMDVAQLPGERRAALAATREFFADARTQLLRDGSAPSKLRDGRLADNPFSAPAGAGGERRLLVQPGRLQLDAPPASGFTLVVKHNALFTALLPELADGLEVLAVVRNPLAVLASWHSVKLPVRDGRLPAGERLDPALGARLDAAADAIARQLLLVDWCCSRFAASLPAERVVRYEDIVATQGQALYAAAGSSGASDAVLRGRNDSDTYRGCDVDALARRLLAGDGAWRHWYTDADVTALAARLGTGAAG
jgi:hypothetical protein